MKQVLEVPIEGLLTYKATQKWLDGLDDWETTQKIACNPFAMPMVLSTPL